MAHQISRPGPALNRGHTSWQANFGAVTLGPAQGAQDSLYPPPPNLTMNSFLRMAPMPLLKATVCLLVFGALMDGCASKKPPEKAKTPAEIAAENQARNQSVEPIFEARVQAISRKNRILTLKFNDEKVAKVNAGNSVRNFEAVGVGDSIKARFSDTVEVFVATPQGKPAWEEIKEIKKAPKGTRPGTAIIRPYELSGTVQSVDASSRRLLIKSAQGKLFAVVGRPDIRRFAEIKTGDLVIARLTDVQSLEILPAPKATSAMRPARRR